MAIQASYSTTGKRCLSLPIVLLYGSVGDDDTLENIAVEQKSSARGFRLAGVPMRERVPVLPPPPPSPTLPSDEELDLLCPAASGQRLRRLEIGRSRRHDASVR